jgi:alpha-tubulin suppressor-like RCC1 family protein
MLLANRDGWVVLAWVLTAACGGRIADDSSGGSSATSTPPNTEISTGGTSATGGAWHAGGFNVATIAIGGAFGTGGAANGGLSYATGGFTGKGGAYATGGKMPTGGVLGSGGAYPTGGRSLTGGASAIGGMALSGGATSWTGGVKSTGGSINTNVGGKATLGGATGVSTDPIVGTIASISAGTYSTCVSLSDGTAWCWGRNESGQLGLGPNDWGDTITVPTAVYGLSSITQVSAGKAHGCALDVNGVVKCWGENSNGELGIGSLQSTNFPVAVSGATGPYAAITSGRGDHTCARDSSNNVMCWGRNNAGQLTNQAPNKFSSTPAWQPVSAVSVTAGLMHTCVVGTDWLSRVWCWGANDYGQLGDGTTTNRDYPVEVFGLTNARAVSAGVNHTCALIGDGTVRCWGTNASGQLGRSTGNTSLVPVEVNGITDAASLSVGLNHSCAVSSSGLVNCWGFDDQGQCGSGASVVLSPGNVIKVAVSGVVAVAAGGSHTCALRQDGILLCWGSNLYGQLGNGRTVSSLAPVRVWRFEAPPG